MFHIFFTEFQLHSCIICWHFLTPYYNWLRCLLLTTHGILYLYEMSLQITFLLWNEAKTFRWCCFRKYDNFFKNYSVLMRNESVLLRSSLIQSMKMLKNVRACVCSFLLVSTARCHENTVSSVKHHNYIIMVFDTYSLTKEKRNVWSENSRSKSVYYFVLEYLKQCVWIEENPKIMCTQPVECVIYARLKFRHWPGINPARYCLIHRTFHFL